MNAGSRDSDRRRTQTHALFIAQQYKLERQLRQPE
jgi:hypothetical protein